MVSVEKLGKGTYFENAFKVSFKYDPTTVAKIKELAERRYLPEDRAWEIPAHELPNLVDKLGLHNINSNSGVMDALKTKEIEDKREATQDRLRGIKPVVDFDFTTTPLPHQIEAFNYGMERDELLIGDEQGLGKTKESIDITVARKRDLCKCLIVCGVNSVKYNWEAEIKTHSKEKSVMLDQKTMPLRVKALNEWLRGSEYYAIINIESLRNEAVQDAIYVGIKDGFIGCIIVDEIHKAKNGSSQQGTALRMLRSPVKIGLSGTPMNKAEDLWNILTWLGVEKRSFYSFRNAYCVMGGFNNKRVVGHKNLESLNAELNKVMLRRKKEEVLDLPPKIHSTEYVELTAKQRKLYKEIEQGIIEDMESILASVNPLSCTLRLRQLTGGLFTEDNAKLERIADMLAEEIIPNGHKAIIFSQWEQVASIYKEALQEYNPVYIVGKVSPEDRQKEVKRFQTDPSCKLAIGTIGAMGTGLTLNKASYVFFIDKLWNSGENAQAEDRAHRIGTAGTVNVISMVAKGSVDEGVEEYLLENKDLFDRVVDGKGSKADIKTILYKLLKI
jgi:SNF2 family DNA or RNA helicase